MSSELSNVAGDKPSKESIKNNKNSAQNNFKIKVINALNGSEKTAFISGSIDILELDHKWTSDFVSPPGFDANSATYDELENNKSARKEHNRIKTSYDTARKLATAKIGELIGEDIIEELDARDHDKLTRHTISGDFLDLYKMIVAHQSTA